VKQVNADSLIRQLPGPEQLCVGVCSYSEPQFSHL
jgi:hypothetical protein